MKPKVRDFFSGIGGFALAFEWAGFETVSFSEIDPYPCKILKQNWPTIPNLGDIRKVPDALEKTNVFCGGFPCQDISTAGKGAGLGTEDNQTRSGLWFEMRRIIGGSRPDFCLIENVPALRTRGADRVLSDLEEIGYACRPFVVGAVHAGAPHKRQRVWIMAYSEPSGRDGRPGAFRESWRSESSDCGSLGNPNGQGLEVRESREPRERPAFVRASWWESEPNVGRVVNGVPNRAHRIKALGNSIVPAVAYPFAKWIRGFYP